MAEPLDAVGSMTQAVELAASPAASNVSRHGPGSPSSRRRPRSVGEPPHRGHRVVRLGGVQPLVQAVAQEQEPVLDDMDHARVGRVIAADVAGRRRSPRRGGARDPRRRTRRRAPRSAGPSGRVARRGSSPRRTRARRRSGRARPARRRSSRAPPRARARPPSCGVRRSARRAQPRRTSDPSASGSAPRGAAAAGRAPRARAGSCPCARPTRPRRAGPWHRCPRRRRAPDGRCARPG